MANGTILIENGSTTPGYLWTDVQIEMVTGTMWFGVWNGTNDAGRASTIATPFNNWYYVGFTYTPSTLTAYVNGNSAGTLSVTRSAPNANSSNLFYSLSGAANGTNFGDANPGKFRFGAIQVYNRQLSSSEVLSNYNLTKTNYGL